jgi:uncharacterized protein (DUF58 family)
MLYTLSMETEINFNRKFRLKNYTLPIVVIGLAIQQYFAPHRAWEILLAAFGGALVLSSIWAFVLWRGLSFRREMRQGWAQVGDRFSEQFTISNKSRFTAFAVELVDHSNFPGYKSSVAWPVGGQFDKLWYMDNVCNKRGLYYVGPTEIRSGDPFGVFEITVRSSLTKEILVTPPIVPLQQIDIASGDWHGNGGTKTKIFERTVTSASVREYVPGDTMFTVHWLTSARWDDLYVRTFDQHPSSDWWIFLDMDRYSQVGAGLDTTDEYATILAASLADRGYKENRAVGLVGEGSKPIWLPPKTGMGQLTEIMYALALVNRGDKSLKALLAKAQRSMERKSSAIVITPSVDPEWLSALTALKQRGVSTTVLLLDQEDFGGEQPSAPILRQLNAWGIRNYLIKKNIYAWPKIQTNFPSQLTTLSTTAGLDQGGN